ncbi:MAG: cytochrome c oxidase assembly factor 1 family protein [Thermoanaerobaculia bacterium]
MTISPQPENPRPRGCWSRHWKWAVPVGCLIVVILAAAAVGGLVLALASSFKSSDVYKMAMTQLRHNASAVEHLGEPIDPGWWVSGSMNVNGASGSADLEIPVHGPKDSGKLYLEAEKHAGQWTFKSLRVQFDKGGSVDLMETSHQVSGEKLQL